MRFFPILFNRTELLKQTAARQFNASRHALNTVQTIFVQDYKPAIYYQEL